MDKQFIIKVQDTQVAAFQTRVYWEYCTELMRDARRHQKLSYGCSWSFSRAEVVFHSPCVDDAAIIAKELEQEQGYFRRIA